MVFEAHKGRHVQHKIYVITLPRAEHRQQAVRTQLEALDVPFTFVEGVDGAALERPPAGYRGRLRRLFYGKDLTAGEIGCFLSHRAALEQFLAEPEPYGVICEDDVTFCGDTAAVVEDIVSQGLDFDLVRMTASDKIARSRKKWHVMDLSGRYALYRMLDLPCGGWAYLVSRQGAQRLLDASRSFWMPFDTLLAMAWHSGVDAYHLLPSPILHEGTETLIGTGRFECRRPSGLAGAVYRLSRPCYKGYEALSRLAMATRYALTDRRRRSS
ncbi:Lipopolysaccharide core biosynthesis glycosyltransferase WadA [Caenispirillum salinarum AK4]|uniref:Lipopolysaccharide core biosynthesis glycosyltransferase WadA n=1 Tax=Caenispirillum salinarum AK4 TaxID=1238182 RepID=K9GNM6_9PROT|nr:Lipopolysaccharide core biosynthesis glycosyltransferase WadA [Caenispirillum salinarum AK4]